MTNNVTIYTELSSLLCRTQLETSSSEKYCHSTFNNFRIYNKKNHRNILNDKSPYCMRIIFLYRFFSSRYALRLTARKPIRVRLTPNRRYLSLLSSTDSDLEAFSHNPTDSSFAPLPFQASANANCLLQNRLF